MSNSQTPYRVFVVDDSRTIRRLIAAIVEETEGLALAGSAESAEDAWEVLKQPGVPVDVVSLDIELPGMNGIEFLKKLMAVNPLPVLVVSGHTDAAADLTLQALEHGAVDCIQKPDGQPHAIDRFLVDTAAGLLQAAGSNRGARAVAMPTQSMAPAPRLAGAGPDPDTLICIGASTGGVPAVCKVVLGLRSAHCPIIVVQHMPPSFTGRLATRLAMTTGLPAQEAVDGVRLKAGTVWVAPGASHLRVTRRGSGYVARLSDEAAVCGHKPSIDVLFKSVAEEAAGNARAAILTGMGRDGAEGLLALHRSGCFTVAQDEASCVVYGMPKAAVMLQAADQVLPLDRISDALLTSTASARARQPRLATGGRHV